MTDFTPLLKRNRSGFARGVAEEQVEPPKAQAEVITPLRGLEGVVAVSFADHSGAVPRSHYAPEPEAPEEPAEPPPPAGPTEEEIAERIAAAEAAVREDYEARLKEAQAEAEAERETLQAVARALSAHHDALTAEAREQAGALVVAAVRRVCGELPEALEGILTDRIGRAAENLVGSTGVVMRVRPADLAAATAALGERPGWRIEADASLEGGCIASSETGSIDGSLSAALDGIQEAAAAWRAEVGVAGGKR